MNIQQSYREAAVRGANPVALVVRLYEQIIEDLRQVAKAIEKNDVHSRSERIKHAILVVGHLQSPLDFASGGKVANDLDHYYNVLRQNLVQIQFQPSQRAVAQLITDLLVIREAWVKVDQAENGQAPNNQAGNPPSPISIAASSLSASQPLFHPSDDNDADSSRTPMDWQG